MENTRDNALEDIYLMWLSRVDGIGIKRQKLLLRRFGSARGVFEASRMELQTLGFMNEQLIHKILSMQDTKFLERYREELERLGMRFIPISAEEYPAALREISEPPAGLYVVGEFPSPDKLMVSMIGSRKCSEYGLTVAYRLGKELAQNGIVVVSGMARGVDSMSHRGALEGGGQTVAVLGCGADVCYPPENKALMQRIKEHGCVVSEYPPGTTPTPGFFPARNRIISGLACAVVVVEAGKHSGTLITVNQALEEGRDVLAVPGNITSKLSCGTNSLIRQGATPVTCCEDILEQLGIVPEDTVKDIALAPVEKLVYDCINFEPVSWEAIYSRLNAPPSDITYVLTILEMRGLIRRLPGHRFIRV